MLPERPELGRILCSRSDVVLLYFRTIGNGGDAQVSVPKITEMFELVEYNIADQVSLLSSLPTVEGNGMIRVWTGLRITGPL